MLPKFFFCLVGERYVHGDKIYVVEAFVAAGGYGSVYRARCGNDLYAIKAQKAGEEAYEAMFRSEVIFMKMVEGLPNVIQMKDSFSQLDHLLMVLEWKGPTVHELISTRPTIARTKTVMRGVVAGLKQIHELRIVHRDLKPENILLSDLSAHEVFLADFGMAGYLKYGDSVLWGDRGTEGFQADEMLNKKPYNTKVDMFSIGITLKLLLWYSKMRDGDDVEEFEDELQWGDDLVENLIRELPEHRLSAEEAEFHPFLADVILKDPDLQYAEEGSLQVVKRDVNRAAMAPRWSATGSLPADKAAIKNATTLPLRRLHNSGP
ncbi:MAG: kinase-like domain-containing protein [Linnemannia elongata]|nr:MAG: kinase-like domain-containing protein [Linnemannia elongata]